MERLSATIRTWRNGWGFANAYPNGELTRYFVHPKFMKDAAQGSLLGLDVRIEFTPGEPRRAGERPIALQIVVLVVPVAPVEPAKAVQS